MELDLAIGPNGGAVDIFVSWSGRRSQRVAEGLRSCLSDVLQFTQPFYSTDDIRKGGRWGGEIAQRLAHANFGIVCLFPENLGSDWLLFESGALSKSLDDGAVWTLLCGGTTPRDLQGPLAQFQHTVAEREDVRRLLRDINAAAGDEALGEQQTDRLFERFWPDLAAVVAEAVALDPDAELARENERQDGAVLEEILELARATAKGMGQFVGSDPAPDYRPPKIITTIHIQPTQDEALLRRFCEACAGHPALRHTRGNFSSGGIGLPDDGGTLTDQFTHFDYRPLSRQAIVEAGNQSGLEIIDVAYRRKA